MTEDKWGNRDAASQYIARMNRATSDREMAEWIREGPEKSDKIRAIGGAMFAVMMIVATISSNGGPSPMLKFMLGTFVIVGFITFLLRKL